MADHATPSAPVSFHADPGGYVHWRASYDGAIARLTFDVKENRPMRPGYVLKLNSYDLGVDIELADALERIRFEHPEVRSVVVHSAKDRIFCSGANIHMLGSSTHAFKVNFCKFTNETRLYLEELSRDSGVRSLCAINGPCAGGGYELAMACDEIVLVEDGSSTVSLPEVPLLGVLPGTGGLTRVTDKRKVRRDRADVFSTLAEGIKGKRAVEWGLVDRVVPRSRFDEAVATRAKELAGLPSNGPERVGPGIPMTEVRSQDGDDSWRYRHVGVQLDRKQRTAAITLNAPEGAAPSSHEDLLRAGAELWMLRLFRELDDALLRLRFNEDTIGLFTIHARGSVAALQEHDRAMVALAEKSWLAREILLKVRRVMKRLDYTARTSFAIVDEGSCFAGSFLEVALAADRIYMLNKEGVEVALSPVNLGPLPMGNGLTRLETRFFGHPEALEAVRGRTGAVGAEEAAELGIATSTPDDIDWEDEVRLAIEERASLSPDALTGMEASLRFAGPETMETKIFARLSAWQNWIFQRPNAVGERGALTLYGHPERPQFDWRRT